MDSSAITAAVASLDGASAGSAPHTLEAGYGANLGGDAAAFAGSLERAAGAIEPEGPSAVAEAMFEPLDFINREAASLAEYAENAITSGNELTPSEIVTLTARSQEFMFHAQLTANIANRTADGAQQLFRQQA